LLGSLNFDGQTYHTVRKTNQTASEILSAIPTTFAGAKEGDVSLFYFSGHGVADTSNYSGSLCGVNADITMNDIVAPSQLRDALNSVAGTVIVLLDSCGSGGYIYSKGTVPEEPTTREDALAFGRSVINAFRGVTAKTGELLTSKYCVLTSCYYNTLSYGFSGVFTNALCTAGGWDSVTHSIVSLFGDSNADKKVTLQEAYVYIRDHTNLETQVVQVYPGNSNFLLFVRP